MSDAPSKAVFLSYASQDAEAARRICEALRSGGVEVWFDVEGGLEHGDEWDAKIRKQIKECVLFVAVISANTQAREEGYFRLEWDLAAERARTIASGVPFILPVVIDDTREPDALVPDRFRAVQWTRIKGGDVPPEVRARFLKLWSHRTGLLKSQTRPAQISAPGAGERSPQEHASRRIPPAAWITALATLVAVAGFIALSPRTNSARLSNPPAAETSVPVGTGKSVPVAPPVSSPPSGLTEARLLIAKIPGLIDALDNSHDDFKLAEELVAQAKAKDPLDAEVWAAEAQVHERYLIRGWDVTDARRESARAATQRAIRLDPKSYEARFAQVGLMAVNGPEAGEMERQLRQLRGERPSDKRVLRMLAGLLDRHGRIEESGAVADESAALPGGDPLALYSKSLGLWFAGRIVEAEAAMQAALAQKPFSGALMMAGWYRLVLHGDFDGARGYIDRIEPSQMIEDRPAFFAFFLEYLARRPDAAIARLKAVPRDWLNDFWFRGSKGWLVGDALEQAGRHDAAVVEWTAALKLVEQRLATNPNNPALLYNHGGLLVRLGRREEAERQLAAVLQLRSVTDINSAGLEARCYVLLGKKAEAIQAIAAGLARKDHATIFPSGLLRLDPIYEGLRSEPEFAKLLAGAEASERAIPAAASKSDLTSTAPAKAEEKSVAVLAFDNRSDDKDAEYFSDGISEELNNALGRVPGLTVKGKTSAFFFKGKQVTSDEIGRQLGVVYLVRGSVRRAGGKVRITAQLSRAATDEIVWSSEPLERDLKDVFAVQDEIVALIAKNLSLKLGAGSAATSRAVNPEAFQLFLAGRAQADKAGADNLKAAADVLEKTIALAPDYVEAWALLSRVNMQLARWGGIATGEGFRRAREAAAKALALDPTAPEALMASGWVKRTVDWDWRGAEASFRQTLALRPNHADTVADAAVLLFNLGRTDEALRLANRAVELDPLNPATQLNLALLFRFTIKLEKSEQAVRRALSLAPEGQRYHGELAATLCEMGRLDEAEREVALEKDGLVRDYVLGSIECARGRKTEARARRAAIEAFGNAHPETADVFSYAAYISARLEEYDHAFASLERAVALRDPGIPWLKVTTDVNKLHPDPRWAALMQKLGLSDEQLK